MQAHAVPFRCPLVGVENCARLPAALTSSARSADGAGDVFLPPGYLIPALTRSEIDAIVADIDFLARF